MATAGFDWRCKCGKVHLRIAPGRSREMVCYCAWCRHFAQEFGEGDTLDAGGGVPMVLMTPDRIEVVSGGDRIAAMRYSEKGAMRWFTRCCQTAIAGTFATGKFPLVTMQAARLEPHDALGPPLVCANAKSATGPVARPAGSLTVMGIGLLADVLGTRLSGRWRRSPFFDEKGRPRVAPKIRPWHPVDAAPPPA